MAEGIYPTEDVDWWLNSLQPSVELAVVELNRLTAIEGMIRVQKARIEKLC